MKDIATVMLLTGALLAGATIVYYWLQDRWSAYQHGLDRCNCGLHDLTDLEAQHTEVAAPYFNFFLDRYTPAYRAELDHFVTAVENGTPPSPGFDDGRAALVLADAANESLRTGATVAIAA